MQRNVKIGLVGAAAVALAACASTRFNSTWKAPEAEPLSYVEHDDGRPNS